MSTENPMGIRIIELPECRMLTSEGADLEAFDQFWSSIDKDRADKFYPRDFMYFDQQKGDLVWLYACEEKHLENGKFKSIPFKGGLYAVCTSKDQDDKDGERVYAGVKKWIEENTAFALDESNERPGLFHVTTSDRAFEKLGYRQLDIYVPIK